ncbi:C-type lectin domain family 4 member A-like [Marmota monax]|uniref:C-type lectin domain family 4 member A-like n=1 Tax=Marmota monax TaxID=9995 RepID=UPI001EAFE080|nr:C-type lectin domain family 4 member A-like [Marmota monax]
MALGNHAEVSLQNEKSSGTNSNSPAGKNHFPVVKVNCEVKDEEIVDKQGRGKVWSCCPENWKSFSYSCCFFSTDAKSWNDSQENRSRMEAHLVVINSKEEQDFITQDMDKNAAYFVGLSDPEGQGHWQWVDQTPYNQSAIFWHLGEPSHSEECCVIVHSRPLSLQWGWNIYFVKIVNDQFVK